MTPAPYRSPAEIEEPATDGEIAFWERAFVALIGREVATQFVAAGKQADVSLEERRKRFGVR